MGSYFQVIVDLDASLEEAEQLAEEVRAILIQRKIIDSVPTDCTLGGTLGYAPGSNYEQAVEGSDSYSVIRGLRDNGLAIKIGRRVFDAGQGGAEVSCPCCQAQQPDDLWIDAIGEWWEDEAKGTFECFFCHYTECVTEWNFDPPWGFGNLGFKFWNWQPLKESFIAEIQQYLGHRIAIVSGKV